MSEPFLSPELRFVQGDCFVGNSKDQQGAPYKNQAGEDVTKWFVAGAGRKGDPLVEAFKRQIEAAGARGFPHLFVNGVCTHPKFSYKIIDGDGVDDNGTSNATKQGFAGHWVFKFGSNFAPRCFPLGKHTPADQLFPPAQGLNPIPKGHYIKVAGTIEPNGQQKKPGVYVNLNLIEYQRYGDPIVNGPDVASIFGGGGVIAAPAAAITYQAAPSYAAQGHTVESLRTAGAGQTDAQLAAAGWLVAVAAPVAPPAPPRPPAPPTPPAPPALAPPAPAAAITYQAAPSYAAQGHTVESLRTAGAGQTDAQLAAAGWLVAVAAPVAPPAPPLAVAPNPAALGVAPPPLAPAGSAPPPPPPAPTAVADGCPPGFKMANPAGTTYAAYIAAQWTDSALVQNGHMVPA